ncbi:DUF2290 domain-containing protein [Pseudomonas mosselii]|uniref:DUF2290 domain-containing protein n=1 Tax=Pseudomonas mosselii TaxID=78327 RepID=UPI0021DA3DAA|nr:DUF2290 domain-containing protein [Pseudomonas mosselii]MCU9531792.1 DUF2290 domain-containing protein [Pseudomonas mosselii]MCU9538303.1 DUF2290 domain-containing protein [Pseudomonas mosselii]MCU9541417.1 DUF2290 domain-containing protein [Pseudomonas mosselii]MCU9550683.1 DUF2290 domain-containing protein [Pseudomonas mosselii]
MTRDAISSGIRKVWQIAEELGISEIFSNPAPLPVNAEFRDLILSGSSTYIDVYNKALALSHYNMLLTDYSFFQFSSDGEENVRYAFYPNPYASSSDEYNNWFRSRQEMVEAELLTHEEFLSLLSSKTGIGSIPLLRYENAPNQRTKFHHPSSHFHIGFHSDNRWPVRRILTPTAFALLVFKLYYGEKWRTIGEDDEPDTIKNKFERNLILEKSRCHLVADDLFEADEERVFHLS